MNAAPRITASQILATVRPDTVSGCALALVQIGAMTNVSDAYDLLQYLVSEQRIPHGKTI